MKHSPSGRGPNRARSLVRLLLAVVVSGANLIAEDRAGKRMNVLFIVADDLRTDLGSYGNAEVITPHLDALASRGVVFNRAYCQQAVCNPSRSSVLTGLRPDTIKVWDLGARFRETTPGVTTLPEHFKRNGYFTRGIGKIFHNETRTVPGRVSMTDPDSWSVPPTHATGAHWQDWVVPGDPRGPSVKAEALQRLDAPDEAYFDGRIATEACAALEELGGQGEPFFLAVGFWKPHLPFNAPKKYWDLYDPGRLAPPAPREFPRGAPEITRHNWSELRSYQGIPANGPLPEDTVRELRHGYYACISFLDAQVGRILTKLKETGLDRDTIVVFWSDHGFHLGEHALWGKTSNYELDARVPLIIADPRTRQAGHSSDALVELIDLFPTLIDLTGLRSPGGLEGASMGPILDDVSLPGKPAALTQHPHPFYGSRWTAMGYSLKTERYRYVEWRARDTRELVAVELYDHRRDPDETANVATHAGYAPTLSHLAELSRDYFKPQASHRN